jgi:flagellar motor switch protein FliG
MSERAGKLARDEMQVMGPVRLSDVDEAQSEIVTIAKQLADNGEIMLISGKDDDELVY